MLAPMRWRAGVGVAAVGAALWAASCSGDNSSADAGPDAAADITMEYYVKDVGVPTAVLVDVAAGASHTCAVVAYGTRNATFCFGKDAALGAPKQGLLATTSTGTAPSPSFVQITTGPEASHTCAIDDAKGVWCWGDNTVGQCGIGNPSPTVDTPQGVLDFNIGPARATSLAVGKATTCTLRYPDDKLTCFGDNGTCEANFHHFDSVQNKEVCDTGLAAAQLGTDDGVVFKNLSILGAGSAHACGYGDPASAGAQALFCWGDNASLESGPAPAGVNAVAVVAASPPKKAVSLAGGAAHTCFVTDSPHELYCFGKNDQHQASPTSASATIDPSSMTPIPLPQSAIPLSVAAGPSETCVADITGQVWCFGASHGTNIDQVPAIKDVTKVVMGGAHACAIGHALSDAPGVPVSLFCWGDNTDGQAGQPPGGTVATPTVVAIPQTAP